MLKLKKLSAMGLAVAMLASLGTTALACEPPVDNGIMLMSSFHHENNRPIDEIGYTVEHYRIYCPDGTDNHNRAKIFFYNATSQAIQIRAEGDVVVVEPWSSDALYVDTVNGDYLSVELRGDVDNTNQVIKGSLSIKSWNE